MKQDKLRRENIILNARTVKFPSNKKGGLNVSDEAKAFIYPDASSYVPIFP